MSELKDLAKKNAEDLSREEAARLAYSRSTVSLDDYNPDELDPEDRVEDWNANVADPLEPSVKPAPSDPVVPLANEGTAVKADSSKPDSATK